MRGTHAATGVCIPAAAVLLLLLGLASFTSSPGDEAVAGPRHVRMLQQAPSKAPKAAAGSKARNSTQVACQWDAKEHVCTPTLAAWTATPGMPSSEYRRAVLMASERDKHCIQHKTAALCARDTAMRCFRAEGEPNATDIRCASSDMEEMLLWSAKGFLPNISIIPHAMACAGSPARAFLDCYAFAGELEACRTLPQCTPLGSLGSLKNLCVPKAWLQQKLGALHKIFAGLLDLDSGVFGTCAATCWLREARECSGITSRQACVAKPQCVYDEHAAQKANSSILTPLEDEDDDDSEELSEDDLKTMGSRPAAAHGLHAAVCRHSAQEFSSSNPVDQAARKVYRQCALARTQEACLKVRAVAPAPAAAAATGVAGSSSRPAKYVNWKAYQPRGNRTTCAKSSPQAGPATAKAVADPEENSGV